jgi:hypothetical protein
MRRTAIDERTTDSDKGIADKGIVPGLARATGRRNFQQAGIVLAVALEIGRAEARGLARAAEEAGRDPQPDPQAAVAPDRARCPRIAAVQPGQTESATAVYRLVPATAVREVAGSVAG